MHPVLVLGEAPAGQQVKQHIECCTEFRALGTRLKVCRVPCQPLTHADSLARTRLRGGLSTARETRPSQLAQRLQAPQVDMP